MFVRSLPCRIANLVAFILCLVVVAAASAMVNPISYWRIDEDDSSNDLFGGATPSSNAFMLSTTDSNYFQVSAVNGAGLPTFGSGTSAPLVITAPVGDITPTSATLHATVNPGGLATTAYFQFGFDVDYQFIIGPIELPGATTNIQISAITAGISLLMPGSVYYFRAIAVNEMDATAGDDLTFTTPGWRPDVLTGPATAIGTNTAVLNASVNPNGVASTVYFEYGPTPDYGLFSSSNTLTGAGAQNVAIPASFSPGTTWHYRIVASNRFGIAAGANSSFTTLGQLVPSVTTLSAAKVNGTLRLNFTNVTGAGFTILATTNVELNVTNWATLGTATENPPGSGRYQFTDSEPNRPRRFYRARKIQPQLPLATGDITQKIKANRAVKSSF
jgi:hypothetical protein